MSDEKHLLNKVETLLSRHRFGISAENAAPDIPLLTEVVEESSLPEADAPGPQAGIELDPITDTVALRPGESVEDALRRLELDTEALLAEVETGQPEGVQAAESPVTNESPGLVGDSALDELADEIGARVLVQLDSYLQVDLQREVLARLGPAIAQAVQAAIEQARGQIADAVTTQIEEALRDRRKQD
jgi:hypothetical protein